jgi:aryl-alcohol dehydrogenase-like predicted oxidoreductase
MAIERRPFGRTGHDSTAVIFGAAALARVDRATADATLDLLLEYGVNHIDTAAGYGDSELRIGPWMDRHRGHFFLATKTRERDYAGAKASIARSLERLRTDRVDLLQLHALFHPDEWDRALGPGGALEAAVEAREQGLVGHVGVTGHGWTVAAMHRRSLERFDFDAILLPWNWLCASRELYAAEFHEVCALARQRGAAVQTIKALARGPWAAGAEKHRSTWYQPLEAEDDIRLAVHWLLAQPGLFLNSVGDVGLLPAVLRAAAAEIEVPDTAAMAAHAERTGLASIFGIGG